MRRLCHVVLISYIGLLLFLLVDSGESDDLQSARPRPRRFVSFQNISHVFWRLNIKANMVPWNQIFAQAVGFRMNWDSPPDSFHPYRHLYRRSAYRQLETLLDSNGVSGLHCIRRAICEVQMISKPAGVYQRILKIFFKRQSSMTDRWHNVTNEDCNESIASCPLSILEASTFTDL